MMVGNERAARPWSLESGKGSVKPGMARGPSGTTPCRDGARNAGQSLVSFETTCFHSADVFLVTFFFLLLLIL